MEYHSNDIIKELIKTHGCPIWFSSDGTPTPLTEMEESHAINIVRYLQKSIEQALIEPINEERYEKLELKIKWLEVISNHFNIQINTYFITSTSDWI